MGLERTIRWSGGIGVLAGVLYAVGALLHPVGEDLAAVLNPRWIPSHVVYWIAAILMTVGLGGIHARQARESGRLGLMSLILAMGGTVVVSGIFFLVSTAIPLIATQAPALFERAMTPPSWAMPAVIAGFALGYVMFGLATIRAGVLPRAAGVILVVGVILFVISETPLFGRATSHAMVTIGDVLFGLGFSWMGYAVWSEPRSEIGV
jgi:hypothetical protein